MHIKLFGFNSYDPNKGCGPMNATPPPPPTLIIEKMVWMMHR